MQNRPLPRRSVRIITVRQLFPEFSLNHRLLATHRHTTPTPPHDALRDNSAMSVCKAFTRPSGYTQTLALLSLSTSHRSTAYLGSCPGNELPFERSLSLVLPTGRWGTQRKNRENIIRGISSAGMVMVRNLTKWPHLTCYIAT